MSEKKSRSLHEVACMGSKFRCDFSSPYPIMQSVSKRASEKSESFIKPFNCYKCDKQLSSRSELFMHLKVIHNACASRDCSKISDFKLHGSGCINRGFGCPICDKKFVEKGLLLIHFNEHIDAAFYACEICREGFQQWKDLQKHLSQAHSKKVSSTVILSQAKAVYQKCGHCSKYFKLFAEYEEHVSSCNSSTYACCTCQVVFTTLTAMDEHRSTEHKLKHALKGNMALKHGKRYFCGVCYLGFTKGDIVKKHLMTHEMDVSFICDVCNENFACDNDLQEHYLLHIEEHYILHNVISQYSCDLCKKTFQTPQELKDHLMVDCKNDGQKSEESGIGHLISESDKENGENNLSQEALQSTSDIDFNTSDIPIYALRSGEELSNCDDSECIIVMDLVSLYVFQRGICASESRMPDVKNSEAYNENDVIDATVLENHMLQLLSPAIENSSACPENSSNVLNNVESSSSDQNLTATSDAVEMLAVNFESNVDSLQLNTQSNCEIIPDRDDMEYSCSENDANTLQLFEGTSTENVIVQENKVPENQIESLSFDDISLNDLFICNICKQIFSSKTSLCLHMQGSHTVFECHQCGKSYSSDSELKNHEMVDHQIAFQCDQCEATYTKEDLLQKHKQSAHGSTEFVCNICEKFYLSSDDYEDHLLLHRESEKTPTQCKICGKIFVSVGNYLRHKEYVHDRKRYNCPICKADNFRTSNAVQVHMRTHVLKTAVNHKCLECKLYFDADAFATHMETHEKA